MSFDLFDLHIPDSHAFRASEIPAAEEVSMEPHPTPEAVAIVPEIPGSERVGPDPADDRVEALLREILTLLKERKALIDVADARSNRATELLEEARLARRLLRDLVGDATDTEDLIHRLDTSFFDAVIAEIRGLLAKPL